MPQVPVDPYDVVMASIRRWCMQYISQADWKETYFARMVNQARSPVVTLQQKPLVSITAIKGDTTLLVVDDDYEIDYHGSMIRFNQSGTNWEAWDWNEITIEYVAGFDPLPLELQQVINQAGASVAMGGELPGSVGAVEIPDVGSVRFLNGSEATEGDALLPALGPFRSLLSGYRDTSKLFADARLKKVERVIAP